MSCSNKCSENANTGRRTKRWIMTVLGIASIAISTTSVALNLMIIDQYKSALNNICHRHGYDRGGVGSNFMWCEEDLFGETSIMAPGNVAPQFREVSE